MSALEGNTALVTGVSHAGQIGEAVARKLATRVPRSSFVRARRAMRKRGHKSYAMPVCVFSASLHL